MNRVRWKLATDLSKTYGNALIVGAFASSIFSAHEVNWPLTVGAIWAGLVFIAGTFYIAPLGEP